MMTTEIQNHFNEYIKKTYGPEGPSGLRSKSDIDAILKRNSIEAMAEKIANPSIKFKLKILAENFDKFSADDQTFIIQCYRFLGSGGELSDGQKIVVGQLLKII